MPSLGTVCHVAAAESPPSNNTLEAAPLGDANAVHKLAYRKHIGAEDVARANGLAEVAELTDATNGHALVLPHMTQNRLAQPLLQLVIEAELDRVVPVGCRSLHLKHPVWSNLHHRHRSHHAVGVIHPRVADLFS